MDYQIYEAGDVVLESGLTSRNTRLAYKTYGTLNKERSNALLYPTSFGAQHSDAEWAIGKGQALDPSKYFIIIPNLFGNGLSTSPSNSPPPYDRGRYPHFTLGDAVRVQERMLREVWGIEKLAAVYGFSMGGQQALHWGAMFPDQVGKVVAICATAKLAPHAWVVFEGIRSALTGDPCWKDGWFDGHPVQGLRAMGRVYAGWGFSQEWYRQGLYKTLGASSIEDFIVSHYEARFLKRNANDLMAMIWTVQHADLGRCAPFGGDLAKALGAIKAPVLALPSQTDFYFQPEDVRTEMAHVSNARVRVIPSIWGHRAGNPVSWAPDAEFISTEVSRFLAESS